MEGNVLAVLLFVAARAPGRGCFGAQPGEGGHGLSVPGGAWAQSVIQQSGGGICGCPWRQAFGIRYKFEDFLLLFVRNICVWIPTVFFYFVFYFNSLLFSASRGLWRLVGCSPGPCDTGYSAGYRWKNTYVQTVWHPSCLYVKHRSIGIATTQSGALYQNHRPPLGATTPSSWTDFPGA